MKKSYFLLLLFVLLMQTIISNAQSQGAVYKSFQDAQVSVSGNPITAAWCGGINSVQVIHADLNNDNKKDIILYDNNTNLLKTFLNIGGIGQINYQYEPKYEANFPEIIDFLELKDYNCDGIPDMFHRGWFGLSIYKGYYQNNELKFTFYKDAFFQGVNGPVNVYVQPGDIPSIIDLDKDGDLDVLSFDVLGSKMTWYKNLRVEDNLICDSMKFVEFELCWGKFFQSIHRAVLTGVTCKGGAAQNKKTRHTGNCALHLDIDGDGDFDMLDGNISFSDVQLLINNGSDIITAQDTLYNQSGHQLNMPIWPAIFHVDIDNDGDKDLLFTSHADNLSSANYNAVAWYQNQGTDASPNFVFQHDTLLTPNMIDVGSYSYPTFFDFDKDGKKDLFVGTEGYLDNATGLLISKIAYYKNTSTLGNVSFDLITKDFLALSSKGYNGIFPTFGDITGDGVDDLVIGKVDGDIAVYKNFAASNLVAPNFVFYTDSMPNITVTNYSFPCIYDFNQDGKTDLLLGSKSGKIAYYEDTSSTTQKKLALKTVSLGNIQAGSVNQLFGYGAPTIAKMDNTNKEFLVIGNIDGNLERYGNFVNNLGSFTKLDSNYSMLKTINRAVPAIDDLDGDGKFDMVIGSKLGGLQYFKQVLNVAIGINDIVENKLDILYYPNPANDNLYIDFAQKISNQDASLKIVDITGRIVKTYSFITNEQSNFDISSLQTGMYIVHFNMGTIQQSAKIIVE